MQQPQDNTMSTKTLLPDSITSEDCRVSGLESFLFIMKDKLTPDTISTPRTRQFKEYCDIFRNTNQIKDAGSAMETLDYLRQAIVVLARTVRDLAKTTDPLILRERTKIIVDHTAGMADSFRTFSRSWDQSFATPPQKSGNTEMLRYGMLATGATITSGAVIVGSLPIALVTVGLTIVGQHLISKMGKPAPETVNDIKVNGKAELMYQQELWSSIAQEGSDILKTRFDGISAQKLEAETQKISDNLVKASELLSFAAADKEFVVVM